MNLIKRHWLIVGLVIVAIAVFAAFQFKGDDKPKFFTTKADRGDIRQVVEATGTINAVTTVQLGSQVSGTISKLFADFNSKVKKGQVVAQIDPSLFQGALLQAQADAANSRANLVAAQANLEKAKATAVQTKADYAAQYRFGQRRRNQPAGSLIWRRPIRTALTLPSMPRRPWSRRRRHSISRNRLRSRWQKQILDYTTIHAPIDGTVIARSVDVGQTVAASLQAPTLFTIAQDLTKMQVYAATDESDVGMIRPGQVVSFKVDAYPKDTFTGAVSQIRMNATTVQNVVTYNTIIDFDNPQLKLFPGMTAYITLPVASATNVIRVPNGALRFKPDLPADETRALYKQYGLISDHPTQAAAGADASGKAARGTGEGQQGGGAAAAAKQRTPRVDVSVIWKLHPDKTLEPVRIRTGITDHTVTEVAQILNGQLNDGDELVTGSQALTAAPAAAPGMGGGARRR